MQEISPRYNPKEVEDKWYAVWEARGLFRGQAQTGRRPYTIVIPPPNVTGILHMGHALNNTIQDILIRYHRMKGDAALWMPGTDHAGIATQNVVEKKLAKEGLKRQDLGREEFLKRVWQWREEYGSTIVRQLKKLGASCDWERLRFTMDDDYSEAVMEVFTRLYEKGLIYRGTYIINWCPRCQTALSDEEAPHRELEGNLYYLRYPIKQNEGRGTKEEGRKKQKNYVVVATTRPETMLGDTAVAVNPKDKRYKHLIGATLSLPLTGREIPVIADDMVDMKFGTGAVKITPAHDPNDYAAGKKHNLPFIAVMRSDGRMNENAGEYNGMDRFEAREVILEDLKEQELIEKLEPHRLSAGHCYRCHTIIEPYLSKQWFVRMKPLSLPAVKAVKNGTVTFYPKRWTKVYLNWMENIQDWCISRQIWWGHRIPVYYCVDCPPGPEGESPIVARARPQSCPKCGSRNIAQDEDVLDTWFSSWLWPFATFGWPFATHSSPLAARRERQATGERRQADPGSKAAEELDFFYPTASLVTAPEIIFFWVARMIMAGYEFMGKPPFKDVYIHGTVRDIEGKKMSKSLGNIIDPLEIIAEYGCDALRFSLISITAQGQDVYLSKERFEQGRNFANKLWNASRFILMNLRSPIQAEDSGIPEDTINRWILSRYHSTIKKCGQYLDSYKFNEAANTLYSFFWHEFCDWYLELVKAGVEHPENQRVLRTVLEGFLRAIHPFMPFISEELTHLLGDGTQGEHSVMNGPWPQVNDKAIDRKLESNVRSIFAVVTAIRNLRSSLGIKPDEKVRVSLYPHAKTQHSLIAAYEPLIARLARTGALAIMKSRGRPEQTLTALTEKVDVYLHFSGLIDAAGERAKLNKGITEKEQLLAAKDARLSNKDFVARAPEEVVAKEKEGRDKLAEDIARMKHLLKELS